MASWKAGIIRYPVDFDARTITDCGCKGEEYFEGDSAAPKRLGEFSRLISQSVRDHLT